MIKRTLVILIILILCGSCSRIFKSEENKEDGFKTILKSLGYSEDTIKLANNFSEDNKNLLLKEYNKELDTLLSFEGISEEDIKVFQILDIDASTYCYLRKHNMLSSENIKLIEDFKKDKYFILENTELYIKYKDNYKSIREVVEYVNTKSYKAQYIQYVMSDITKGIHMIASKIYYLYHYEPDNLVDVDDDYKMPSSSPTMVQEAYEAFKKMSDAASSKGLKIKVTSGYRSYDYQKRIYEGYLKKDPQEFVDTYSSRPGFSDHQIGLSCDVWADNKTFEEFSFTKESAWLKENAYKYGFIMRYPYGKDYITGYMYESWHYRYVGKEAAKEIHDNDITFDEYYAYYIENK